jgi:hypothetical protein
MMLREPVTMISPPFGVLCEVESMAERQRRIPTLADRGEIENGMENRLHRM